MCKLKRAIYGLKQSLRAWFEKFSEVVLEVGFSHSCADHSIFVRDGKFGVVILVVYVDDMVLYGSDNVGIEDTKKYLPKHFDVKYLGLLCNNPNIMS